MHYGLTYRFEGGFNFVALLQHGMLLVLQFACRTQGVHVVEKLWSIIFLGSHVSQAMRVPIFWSKDSVRGLKICTLINDSPQEVRGNVFANSGMNAMRCLNHGRQVKLT